jgi:hypothetical protein
LLDAIPLPPPSNYTITTKTNEPTTPTPRPTSQGIRKWSLAVAVELLSVRALSPWLLPRRPMAPSMVGNDELLDSVENGAELAAWALDR